jgi:ubiquitin C-terminal hydrolase
MCSAYTDLVKSYQSSSSAVNPSSIKKYTNKLFDPSEQHDCHEVLRYILSEMQDEMNPAKRIPTNPNDNLNSEQAWTQYKAGHPSFIDDVFTGLISSKISCKHCNYLSEAHDPFMDLSVPLPDKGRPTLADTLEGYFKEDRLSDFWTCEKCKQKSKPVRKIEMSVAPDILVVQLKRFKTYPRKRKLNDIVEYPVTGFDLSE